MQRRAKFVAHAGQASAFCLACVLRSFLGALQLLCSPSFADVTNDRSKHRTDSVGPGSEGEFKGKKRLILLQSLQLHGFTDDLRSAGQSKPLETFLVVGPVCFG